MRNRISNKRVEKLIDIENSPHDSSTYKYTSDLERILLDLQDARKQNKLLKKLQEHERVKRKLAKCDVTIKNHAPDMDAIAVMVWSGVKPGETPDKEWKIEVSRDEDGKVYIEVCDLKEDSITRLVLGQEGETQKF